MSAFAHLTIEVSALLSPPRLLVAQKTMDDLPDDLLDHVLLCVEWKHQASAPFLLLAPFQLILMGLRASRLVCRRWRDHLTRDWFLRWRSESTQRELLRQLGPADSLAEGDLRGATALLASADMSVLVKGASYVSEARRDSGHFPSWGECDVQRHATGWELGQDAQVVVAWSASLYPFESDRLFDAAGNDADGMAYCKLLRPSVFFIYREEGARGFVWEFCRVDQYFDGEWGDFYVNECLTTEAGAREFKDVVASYLPEVAEMSPSVLLALTICSSRTKLCDLLDSDPTARLFKYMIQPSSVICEKSNNDAWTVRKLSQLIQEGMAHPSGQDEAAPTGPYVSSYLDWPYVSSAAYDAVVDPLETLSLWFDGADIGNERWSLAKWVRSVQNKGLFSDFKPCSPHGKRPRPPPGPQDLLSSEAAFSFSDFRISLNSVGFRFSES